MNALLWILAILAVLFIPFYCSYLVRRAKQVQFAKKWDLPEEELSNDVDRTEVLGKTGFIDDMTDGRNV